MLQNLIAYLRKHQAIMRRYVFVGGFNTIVGLAMFPVLQTVLGPWGVHYLVTLCIAQIICVVLSYTTMKTFVFSAAPTSFVRFLLYSLFQGSSFAVNFVALPVLVHLSDRDPRIVQFCLGLTLTILGLLWQLRVVFRR